VQNQVQSFFEIIDISPPICEETAVWPGDVPFSRSVQADIRTGANIHLSSFTSTVHCGAHADAPLHYEKDGAPINLVSLHHYLGPCQIITVKPAKDRLIKPADFVGSVHENTTRILFRTNSQPRFDHFNTDFAAFAPESIEWCGTKGIVLIGIDTPSFDLFDSKALPAHKMLLKYDIRNLECLDLTNAKDGIYELIALPLKLKGFDASPVRAVLRRPLTS
jgi:arylformamidase